MVRAKLTQIQVSPPPETLPPLSADEFERLKASIEAVGILTPIDVDENLGILDGWNRFQAAMQLGLDDVPVTVRPGLTDVEKRTFTRRANLIRRQVKPADRRRLVENQLRDTPEFANRHIASICNVDHKTVGQRRRRLEASGDIPALPSATGQDGKQRPLKRVARIHAPNLVAASKVSDLLADLGSDIVDRLAGSRYLNRPKDLKPLLPLPSDQRERAADMLATGEAKSVTSAVHRARMAEAVEIARCVPQDGQDYRLLTCDIKDMVHQVEPGSVDCVLTDPPYGRSAIPLYEHLADLAAHALKPGGSLLLMTGQMILPDVLSIIGARLTYRWALCYLVESAGSPPAPTALLGMNSWWKPVLWFTNGERLGGGHGDIIRSGPKAKDGHPWQQDEQGFETIVQRFTLPGDLVMDPFSGTGTTAVVCLRNGRRIIASDNDPERMVQTRARLLPYLNADQGQEAA
jgi:hypothetical protein